MPIWHVLLTEPNRESTASRHLSQLGCDPYLPLFAKAKCQRVSGGRRWRVWRRPLFPGYLFIQQRENLFALVRQAAGVRQSERLPFLAHDGRPAVVADDKILEIRGLERLMNVKRSNRMQFRLGDRVLVLDGPFTGLRATIYTLTDSQRITLLLDFLGRPTKVCLPTSALEGPAA